MSPEAREASNKMLDDVLKLVDPGAPPCDCCHEVDGAWTFDCNCQNFGYIAGASQFCSAKTLMKNISILRR